LSFFMRKKKAVELKRMWNEMWKSV
jgi:hypothetical protein